MKITAIVLVVVMGMLGCGGAKFTRGTKEIPRPTVVKSIEELPKASVSLVEIQETWVIRVIAESAQNQEQYDAIEAARGVAQRNILVMLNGLRISSAKMIESGNLKKDEIKLLVDCMVLTYDCGAFYDKTLKVAYVCVEMPVRD